MTWAPKAGVVPSALTTRPRTTPLACTCTDTVFSCAGLTFPVAVPYKTNVPLTTFKVTVKGPASTSGKKNAPSPFTVAVRV